jgi:hypothetical protein
MNFCEMDHTMENAHAGHKNTYMISSKIPLGGYRCGCGILLKLILKKQNVFVGSTDGLF